MADVRYIVGMNGEGVKGRGSRWLGPAIRKLQRKLRARAGKPYHLAGHPKHEMPLDEMMKDVKQRMAQHNPGLKLVVRGHNYDDPAFFIKSVDVAPVVAEVVTWGEQYVGRSPYLLGSSGPPGQSDCSAFTTACYNSIGVHLTAYSVSQYEDPRVHLFHDPADLESGDLVFFRYTDRTGGPVDHVELFVKPMLNIGSRPSTNGVNYYHWTSSSEPDWAWVAYGRVGG